MATINLTPVIVVFVHVVIVLMLEMMVDHRILGRKHCQIACAFRGGTESWCIIGEEDDGFVRLEVAFSVMFAVVHEDTIC